MVIGSTSLTRSDTKYASDLCLLVNWLENSSVNKATLYVEHREAMNEYTSLLFNIHSLPCIVDSLTVFFFLFAFSPLLDLTCLSVFPYLHLPLLNSFIHISLQLDHSFPSITFYWWWSLDSPFLLSRTVNGMIYLLAKQKWSNHLIVSISDGGIYFSFHCVFCLFYIAFLVAVACMLLEILSAPHTLRMCTGL